MRISSKEMIDPTYKGNMARFINHSCAPNCITEKWHVLGEICVGIFSINKESLDWFLRFSLFCFISLFTKVNREDSFLGVSW